MLTREDLDNIIFEQEPDFIPTENMVYKSFYESGPMEAIANFLDDIPKTRPRAVAIARRPMDFIYLRTRSNCTRFRVAGTLTSVEGETLFLKNTITSQLELSAGSWDLMMASQVHPRRQAVLVR